jgi:hypothetical protein
MSHDEIKQSGIAHVGLLVLGHHEEIGNQRHQLPGDEEKKSIVGKSDQCHRQQKAVVE